MLDNMANDRLNSGIVRSNKNHIMPRMFAAAIVLAIACHAAPVLMASAADLYVSTTGSDTNPGTLSAPLRTIPAASQKATAGTTIYVAPGTYTGGFQTPVSGTATAHIHFVSTIKYGAKLVPPAGSTSGIAWWIRGGYTDVDGFEIDGTSYLGGINWTVGIEADGNYDTVENNLIHNIHDISVTACSGHGAAGIDFYGFNYGHTGGTANANTVHDVTWHGTCSYDNGIYANTPRIVLTNNLVYNIIGSVAIENWHGATKNTIVNNTVYNNS